MPCETHGPKKDYKEEADKATRLLCEVCRTLEFSPLGIMNPELKAWWAEHKEYDRKRES